MSTLKVLKEYLVGAGGYLLNDDNNGKTVMLSGAWGSGKTHFWQKGIEPELSEKLKEDNKACVYVSLYGKDSLKEIKEEVFFKASKEKDYLSEEIEVFGFDTLSTIADNGGEISKGIKVIFDLNKYRRSSKGKNKLKDGGLICFDDFERKSKNIDLNDLFGFISQLAINLKCKVVIILNSDVFEGEEANVFKTVKEKTVNKFFYFEPTIEELFDSIYSSHEKYKKLDEYKDEILKAIKETEELNARIYIQVLDNCLEWIDKKENTNALRSLVLNTVCYIKYHFILSYPVYIDVREANTTHVNEGVAYNEFRSSSDISWYILQRFLKKDLNEKVFMQNRMDSLHDDLMSHIGGKNISGEEKQIMLDEVDKFYDDYLVMIKFGYKLFVARDIDKEVYKDISNFIKTGILLKKDEPSS
jgi:hypothetical protein